MIDIGDEVGFLDVKMAGVEKHLDVWEVSGKLSELAHGEDGNADYLSRVREYLTTLGYPPVSAYLADRFARTVWGRVAELKKLGAGSGNAGSPASTDSGPAA